MNEALSPAMRLFEITEFGYYALDYSEVVQKFGNTLDAIIQCQYFIMGLLAVLICVLLMFIFGFAFRSRF